MLLGKNLVETKGIDRFQVYGERRSGTNFVAKTLAKNTGLKRWTAYGWKHGFPVFPVLPSRCLFVVVVRDPLDWLKSFYAAPFEVPKEMADLSFSDFIRHEWRGEARISEANWKSHGYHIPRGTAGRETLQLERHPISGRPIRNVLELRSLKLEAHLGMIDREINAIALRYEDFRSAPAVFCKEVNSLLGRKNGDFVEIRKRAGPDVDNNRIPKQVSVCEDDLSFIRDGLDWRQEKRCGYTM